MIELSSIMPSHVLKEILLYAILFLLATVLILFTTLIFHKIYTERKEKKKKYLKNEYNLEINQYLARGKSNLKWPRTKLEHESLGETCIDLLLSVSPESEKKMKELIKALPLIEYYQRLAESSSWIKRFYAIEKLGFLMQDELKDYFLGIINKEKSPYVKAKAVWSLSLIADEDALSKITHILPSEIPLSSKFNEYIYTNIIRSFQKKALIDRFLFYLEALINDDKTPLILKRDIIEACGSSGLKEAEKTITHYFHHLRSHPQIRITSIRALGKLKSPEAHKAVLAGFADEDWRVRAVSAEAASSCNKGVIPHLQTLLYDKFYYVRINATKTLVQFGQQGQLALQSEMNSKDKFVRETVRFYLKK